MCSALFLKVLYSMYPVSPGIAAWLRQYPPFSILAPLTVTGLRVPASHGFRTTVRHQRLMINHDRKNFIRTMVRQLRADAGSKTEEDDFL